MYKHIFQGLGRITAAGLALTIATPSLGHDVEDHPLVQAVDHALGLELSLDVVSQYFFRGYEQQDSGLIFQPGVAFTVPVDDDVSAYFGVWESFHSVPTPGAPTGPKSWYEQDVYAGFSVALSEVVTLDLNYTGYFSPSDSFSDIHEVGVLLAFEDEQWMGEAWSFDPYVFVAFEVQDNGGTEDTYLELGGEFGFDYSEDVAVAVPVVLGLSIDDYYTDAAGDNEFFGYFSVGCLATVPMSKIVGNEAWAGPWSLTAGVTLLLLNDDAGLTDDTSGSSDSVQVIGSIGLSREW